MCWRFVLVASASCPDPTLDSLRVSVRPQAEMAESRFFQNHSLRNANRQRSAMSLMGRSPSIRDMSLPDSGRWLIPRGSASFHACVGGNNTPARPDLFGAHPMRNQVGLIHESARRLPWRVYWFTPPDADGKQLIRFSFRTRA